MTTKEKITDEALTLFSVQGFKGTSVRDIADAVGIKDSSLYKHFHSKQEIFDTIVADTYRHMGELAVRLGMPEDSEKLEAAAEFYGALDLAGLKSLAQNVFAFYLTDGFMSRFWKMANAEQYRNPEIYEIFRRIFMEEGIAYQKDLFAQMIRQGVFIEADPEIMAVNFYAPIFFLLSKYSGKTKEAETQDAFSLLDRLMEEFWRRYRAE